MSKVKFEYIVLLKDNKDDNVLHYKYLRFKTKINKSIIEKLEYKFNGKVLKVEFQNTLEKLDLW